MTFDELGLAPPLLRAVTTAGYTTPTPIQAQAIGHLLAGHDLLGCAQTGTGKTAAFALPILHRLMSSSDPARREHRRRLRVLVLSPTRELAAQIGESFSTYGRHTGLRHTVVFGGVNQWPQTRALTQGVDILVATPGRLVDLMNQGFVDLTNIDTFVLDEADRMLDMGFLPDMRRVIAKLPRQRQTIFFSATMPTEIDALANSILREPVRVRVAPVRETTELIDQSVVFVTRGNKPKLLSGLLATRPFSRVLVFTRTKRGADRVARHLEQEGIRAAAIHGNKSQAQRQRTLASFKAGRTGVLVATDLAARGLDVEGISHVFNFDLPFEPETYVHRIGRTGRAGATGTAIAFCDAEERPMLAAIERLTRQRLTVDREASTAAGTPAQPARTTDMPPRRPSNSAGRPQHVPPRDGGNNHERRTAGGRPSGGPSKPAKKFYGRRKSRRHVVGVGGA